VERIITGTPQPATREPSTLTPTPNATQTQAAFITGIENSIAKRWNMFWWAVGSFGLMFSVIFSIMVAVDLVKTLLPKRPTMEDTREEADEILTVNDARRDRRILQLRRAGWSINKICMEIFGYTGGSAYDTVKRVITENPTPPLTEDYNYGNTTQA